MKEELIEIKNKISKDKFADFEGPKPLRTNTLEFQKVVWKILDGDSNIRFHHDPTGDLKATWHENCIKRTVNLTQGLQKKVDFDQIILSVKDCDTYLEFIKTESEFAVNANKKRKFYLKREKRKNKIYNLDLAEKIAINIYTSDAYEKINQFLRNYGKISADFFKEFKNDNKFQIIIKDIICVIVFATRGLNKLDEDSGNTDKWRFRQMYLASENELFFVEKIQAFQEEKSSLETAFLSSSVLERKTNFTPQEDDKRFNFFQLVSGRSFKDVTIYSQYPKEQEVLSPPGGFYKNIAYVNKNGKYFLVSKELNDFKLDQQLNVSGDSAYLQALKTRLPDTTQAVVSNKFSFFHSQSVKISAILALSTAAWALMSTN